MPFRPRRSALYMPGSNVRALEKSRTLPCDVVILDLEDAVAPDAKELARGQIAATLAAGGFAPRELIVRINALSTPWGDADLAALTTGGASLPDAILVPKVSQPDDLERVAAQIADAPAKLKLWAMMETPLAILNAREIAAVATAPGSRLAGFVLGTNDLVKETGASLDADRTAALYWLSAVATAAKAYGLAVLDGVYNDFKDADGFQRECRQGRRLGMDGKTLIHPGQIAAANEIFAPTVEEIAWARRVVAAFEDPAVAAKGAITIDGRMVERLHEVMARRVVEIAEAIAGS